MIERYRHGGDYCATARYQGWLAQWEPPHQIQVDHWVDVEFWKDDGPVQTPRQWGLTRCATRMAFHLLDSLHMADLPCVDIGCGWNWFKRIYPHIWGVDPHNEPYRDELLTAEWWIGNWGRWRRCFSINALHHCDQREIGGEIAKVRGILTPGGTALITLNRARMRDFTQRWDSEQLYRDLAQTQGLTRMVWLDEPWEAPMDGNVWLWIQA